MMRLGSSSYKLKDHLLSKAPRREALIKDRVGCVGGGREMAIREVICL